MLTARQLFRNTGMAMTIWNKEEDLHRIQELFNMELLRGTAQNLPEAPFDTAWAPATRTLSTTAMPECATRLEVWRTGPGGMPERLAVGERFALSVVIPATITFDPGDLYQLWLQSVNSKGVSGPGPMQSWVAE